MSREPLLFGTSNQTLNFSDSLKGGGEGDTEGGGHTPVGGRQALYYSMSGMKAPIIIAVSQFMIRLLLLLHLAILSISTQYQF